MDTQILRWWAKFKKLSNIDKRRLFSQLVLEESGISCELNIYRILTRLNFKRYKNLHKIPHPQDRLIQKLLDELNLSPSTVHNWYWVTKDEIALELNGTECQDNIERKYEYGLVSKRIYQLLIKIEKFKHLLNDKYDELETRKILRRLVEYCYYSKKPVTYTEQEQEFLEALQKMKIKPITALKWFYIAKDSGELIELAKANKISPNDIIRGCIKLMRTDLRNVVYELGGELA